MLSDALNAVIGMTTLLSDVAVNVFTVGATRSRSTAPMSHVPFCGRLRLRWSVAVQPVLVPASMAAEPAPGRCVWVTPPLSASEPRLGSPLTAAEQEPSSIKLLLEAPFKLVPLKRTQSPPLVLVALITFFSVGLLALLLNSPPPNAVGAVLPLKVTLVSTGLLLLLIYI